jgi:hypothetical protein
MTQISKKLLIIHLISLNKMIKNINFLNNLFNHTNIKKCLFQEIYFKRVEYVQFKKLYTLFK